ncbi:hypothetical protein, partial [Lentzea flava]|uniref:hypothetical protein n=1 Tax=Lentzea flava TaxID=103732 RepID=UPI001E375989
LEVHRNPSTEVLRRPLEPKLVRGGRRCSITARPYGGDPRKYLVHVCVDGTAASVAALVEVITTEARATGL